MIIPSLKKEKSELRLKLQEMKQLLNNDNNAPQPPQQSVSTIDEIMEIRDRIKEINSTIKDHEHTYKSYYLNNSEYIFEYFENKKTITTGGATKTKSLNAFFKLPEAKKAEELHLNAHNNVQKYLSSIDHNYIDISKYVYRV